MTQVNWERYSGAEVEEFVSALLLLRDPKGNRITPSQGARGVDVRIRDNYGGFRFYQIKRFTGPLKSTQKRQIEKSWRTFLKETAPYYNVASWNLVMPYDPTNQNIEWLRSLTQSSDIMVNWVGRTHLDNWASENPQLVDYYFGDGRKRTEELIAKALTIGETRSSIEKEPGERKIRALMENALSVQKLLNDVDPFYRYEYEVRHGSFAILQEELLHPSYEGEVFSSVTPLGDTDNNVVLHVIARCSASISFRPIRIGMTFQVDAGSAEYDSLQKFLQYGSPAQRIPAKITSYDGPPGGPLPGAGIVTMLNVEDSNKMIPPLEIEFIPNDCSMAPAIVNIRNIQHGVGVSGGGTHLSMSDDADVFTMRMLISSSKELEDLSIDRTSLVGRKPHEVLSALQFLEKFNGGGEMELRVRDGISLIRIRVETLKDRRYAARYRLLKQFVESLVEIQRHVMWSIVIPSAESCTDSDVRNIIRCARLLKGEQVERTWEYLDLTIKDPSSLNSLAGTENGEGTLLLRKSLMITVGGKELDTGYVLQTVYKRARIAEEANRKEYAIDEVIRLVPGMDNTVVMSAIKA